MITFMYEMIGEEVVVENDEKKKDGKRLKNGPGRPYI
jgi:hypothetical protein